MLNKCKLILNPSNSEFCNIKKWLVTEFKKVGSGFYYNLNIIESAFEMNRLFILNYDNKPIGFLVWGSNNICVNFHIFEIKPVYRKKGFGKLFFSLIEDYFIKMDYKVIELFCEPEESEPFWQKMGFIKSPELGYHEHDLTYFKPLINTQDQCDPQIESNIIEVWDVEPYKANILPPRWVWSFDTNSSLQLPILQRVDRNWKIRRSIKGKVIQEGKIKYFVNGDNCILLSSYLFINTLID